MLRGIVLTREGHMMEKAHDTLRDLHRGTPLWFTTSGWLVPAGVLAQFLLAGQALYGNTGFGVHAVLGTLLVLPVLALLLGPLLVSRLRGFGWWAGILAVLMLVQFVLAAGNAKPFLAYHPANGALVLATSLVLLVKIERRRVHAAR
ncbi:DUF6220 domain-containing protein [Novosphingobium sp. RD2P27]|uniref:DUF6220 domain-containing protein n=1 Tax=Novosphingobium kalidii TaxID=3230299 RepID=A0ABV2D1N3_9SPHN